MRPTKSDSLTPSVSFSILASRRRRIVLRELFDHGRSVSVANLRRSIEREQPDADRRRIAGELHHTHLPKLEAAGLVFVDGTDVTLTEYGAGIEPYLLLTGDETPKK
ncbi:DUF7344 domain-containing protein [Haladaptatus sp. NG-WS-4]